MKKVWILLALLALSTEAFGKTKCIAHRGNNEKHLENSWAGIISAFEIGSHGVEFDLMHTLGGDAILMHDKTLMRTAKSRADKKCELNEPIHNLTLRHIAEHCVLKNGEEIPLFADVLQFFGDKAILLFIEIKDFPSMQTAQLIEKTFKHAPERIRLISFKKNHLDFLKRLSKVWPFWDEVKMLKNYRFLPPPFSKYGSNIAYRRFTLPLIFQIPRVFKREVGFWTVDSKKRMKKIIRRRGQFLTTNRPELCLDLSYGV